jgi:hypothetical protein
VAQRTLAGKVGRALLVAALVGLGRSSTAEITSPLPTPVAANAYLGTQRNAIVSEHGVTTQLRGVSPHGIQWCGDSHRDG